MPLPPRDLSTTHLALNPCLMEMHLAFPLSRFAPAVPLLRLFKLGIDGCPLASMLDGTAWMTLACLDDQAGDYCLACAVAAWQASPRSHATVSAALVHAATPFVMPVMVPVPPVQPVHVVQPVLMSGAHCSEPAEHDHPDHPDHRGRRGRRGGRRGPPRPVPPPRTGVAPVSKAPLFVDAAEETSTTSTAVSRHAAEATAATSSGISRRCHAASSDASQTSTTSTAASRHVDPPALPGRADDAPRPWPDEAELLGSVARRLVAMPRATVRKALHEFVVVAGCRKDDDRPMPAAAAAKVMARVLAKYET